MKMTAHKINSLTPMLGCDDVPASIAFYRDKLGFELVNSMDFEGKTGWAFLKNGTIELMLMNNMEGQRGTTNGTIYYFYPEDVTGLHQALNDKGLATTKLINTFYGMKEFHTLDPSGHVLCFGQDTDEAPSDEQLVNEAWNWIKQQREGL